MNTFLFILPALLGVALGSEWLTSGGYHCTEKCMIGKRRDREEVYWCPVVDGLSLEHKPVASSRPSVQDNKIDEEDKIMWDYCTPAVVAGIPQEENEDFVETVTLPAHVNRTKRQTGSGGNFNPGKNVIVPSSLPGVDCVGACTMRSDEKTQCDIPGIEKQSFYCSPKASLERKQVSSKERLWCTSPCLKNSGDDYYMCKTLYGSDRCSPSADRSAKGETCYSSCEKEGTSYKCHTDDKMTKQDECGLYNHPKAGMKAIEYTVDNQVCAGPCEEIEGNLMCKYVEWQWKNDLNMATLTPMMGSCDPNASSGTSGVVIGIIIGCIVLAIIVIIVVAGVVKKRKYSPAATGDV